jgi:hypothetical protein
VENIFSKVQTVENVENDSTAGGQQTYSRRSRHISQKFRVKIMLKETNVHEIPEDIEARHCASEFYSEDRRLTAGLFIIT